MLGVAIAALLAVSAASTAFAYGKENWQTTFAGSAVTPGGTSFGFWGWCAFGGGVTSGNTADCEFAQYVHNSPQGSFTCHESLDVASWTVSPVTDDFVIAGTATITPSGSLANVLLGPHQVGEFQIQVTQIP